MNISDYTSVQSPALKQKDSDSMINQWKDQRMRRLEDYSREFSQPEKSGPHHHLRHQIQSD